MRALYGRAGSIEFHPRSPPPTIRPLPRPQRRRQAGPLACQHVQVVTTTRRRSVKPTFTAYRNAGRVGNESGFSGREACERTKLTSVPPPTVPCPPSVAVPVLSYELISTVNASNDLYEILGCTKYTADKQEFRKSYMHRAKLVHPEFVARPTLGRSPARRWQPSLAD